MFKTGLMSDVITLTLLIFIGSLLIDHFSKSKIAVLLVKSNSLRKVPFYVKSESRELLSYQDRKGLPAIRNDE
jgi:hypothetical protein